MGEPPPSLQKNHTQCWYSQSAMVSELLSCICIGIGLRFTQKHELNQYKQLFSSNVEALDLALNSIQIASEIWSAILSWVPLRYRFRRE